jgi:hypothetical protein
MNGGIEVKDWYVHFVLSGEKGKERKKEAGRERERREKK